MKIMIHLGGTNNAYHVIDKINTIVNKYVSQCCYL